MLDPFTRTVRTRSGKTFSGSPSDFVESCQYLEYVHWLFPWKKERIYIYDIESDQNDMSSEAIVGVFLLTLLIIGFISFIVVEAEGWPINQNTSGIKSALETQCAVANLQRGDQGALVFQLQSLLSEFYVYKPDGIFGKFTEQAVRDYQQTHALPVTGIVNAATWAKLSDDCLLL